MAWGREAPFPFAPQLLVTRWYDSVPCTRYWGMPVGLRISKADWYSGGAAEESL